MAWEVDPDGPPSPDCEDNALAGAVTIGDAFPSGHTSPPMHPGLPLPLARDRRVAFAPVRRASDFPGRRAGRRISGRAILIVIGVLFLLVIVFGRAVARFYVDFLWHDGLGRADVFWGVIRAKVTLFALFFAAFAVLAGLNLLIADRLSPSRFPANVHPYVERFHELFGHRLRLLRYAGAGVLAVMVALPTTSQWQSWLLFRHSQSFGLPDAQFGADVGFYVFELPFLGFVLDWLFVAMVLVLMITLLAHVLNGGVMFASPVPSVRPATKGHIAVLLAVLAALKAADYWVTSLRDDERAPRLRPGRHLRRRPRPAAGADAAHAHRPADGRLYLLTLRTRVVAAAADRLGAVARRPDRRRPGVPGARAVARRQPEPAGPRAALHRPQRRGHPRGDGHQHRRHRRAQLAFDRLTARVDRVRSRPAADVRLLNPTEMLSRFRIDRGVEAGLRIDDLDVDRYDIDGRLQQVLIAARELDLDGSPNQSWQGRHLINTRGCGLVMAPVGPVQESDSPTTSPSS